MTIEISGFNRQYTSKRCLVTPSYRTYPAYITIKHWQLRDLVCVSSSSSNKIFYPHDYDIHSLNLDTGTPETVATFDFEPRCIQTCGDIIAVGALQESARRMSSRYTHSSNTHGVFAVHNLQTKSCLSTVIGSCINNSISLYPLAQNSQYKAIVCNNDWHLYIADISNSRVEVSTKTKFEASLNHASISPDQKTIVACGDVRKVYICHPEERPRASQSLDTHNDNWSIASSLEGWSSFGFSTAFHDSGIIFGAAFQNGVANLYDMRNLDQPLTKIYSTRPREFIGAFRCLKFSRGLADMVFVSEQMGRVHAVDMRNFSNHQVLMVPKKINSCGSGDEYGRNQDAQHQDQTPPWNAYNDPNLVRQYDEMISAGDATGFVPSRQDLELGSSTSEYETADYSPILGSATMSRNPLRSHFYTHPRSQQSRDTIHDTSSQISNSFSDSVGEFSFNDRNELLNEPDNRARQVRFSTDSSTSPQNRRPNHEREPLLNRSRRPVYIVVPPSTNSRSESMAMFDLDHSNIPDPFHDGSVFSLFSRSPTRQIQGGRNVNNSDQAALSNNGRGSRESPSLILGSGRGLPTNRATSRRTLLLEQQMMDESSFSRSYDSRFIELRNFSRVRHDNPKAIETDSVSSDERMDSEERTDDHERVVGSDALLPDYSTPLPVVYVNDNEQSQQRASRVANREETNRTSSAWTQPFPLHSYSDYGVSGIAWSDFQGGSVIVGNDKDIGVWSIDRLESITFPNYEQR